MRRDQAPTPYRPTEAAQPSLADLPPLSEEQTRVLQQIREVPDGGLFITGRAGTGKSTLLRALAAEMVGECAVVAPTGLAAMNVGGQTIHSFFGIRPGPVVNDPDIIKIYRGGHPKARLMKGLKALIIDEISMVRADLLDGIDFSLRRNRERDEPFGGVKVVFFGDLLQLEPVVKRGAEMEMLADRYASPFFFDCLALKDAPPDVIELTEVHRQATDPEMLHALNQLRNADLEALELFNTRLHARIDEAKFITLTPRRDTADALNATRLAEIPGEGRSYKGATEGDFYEEYPTDPQLRLKVGARVMMVRSQPPDWVNGSLGTVAELGEKTVRVQLDSGETHWVESVKWEKVRWTWDSGRGRIGAEVIGSFVQLPMRLAWALTVHKAQGLTFDAVRLDFGSRAFAHGQLYVALSRCRTLAGVSLASPLRAQDLIIDPRVLELHGQLGLA